MFEIDEFINKAKQNINTAVFTINMAQKPLSEVTIFLEMFVPEVEVTEANSEQIRYITSGQEDDERK